MRRPRRSTGAVRATAAPPAPLAAGTVAWERTLPLGPGASVTVQVATGGDEQRILVVTNRPGRLLLHWGVEGGRNYKGGWRLPGDRCQPDGTINYKNRALQTPFRPAGGNGSGLQVRQGIGWGWRGLQLQHWARSPPGGHVQGPLLGGCVLHFSLIVPVLGHPRHLQCFLLPRLLPVV